MRISQFLIFLLFCSLQACHPIQETSLGSQLNNCRDIASSQGLKRPARRSNYFNQLFTEEDSAEIALVISKGSFSPLGSEGDVMWIAFNGKRWDCQYSDLHKKANTDAPEMSCQLSSYVYSDLDLLNNAIRTSQFMDWPSALFPERLYTLGSNMSIGYREAKGANLVFKEARDGCISPKMRELDSLVDSLAD